MTQNLSETWASRGRCSLISRPGVRQAIGRNGPRIFSGASGLRSKVSSWLGPPNRKMKITDLAAAGADGRDRLGREHARQAQAEETGPGRFEQPSAA